ncbi:MAG: acyl-CoA dehydrogenase family protein [Acidimicrobiales bacterium]
MIADQSHHAPIEDIMTTLHPLRTEPLTDDMLARFDERAPQYDRENRFFSEDFEELRDSGYLLLAVPQELGGYGLTLAEVMAHQRRLAYHAPATAIAINMHLYWTGVAADMARFGDDSLGWILEAAAQGEVFAAGHGEVGNDAGLVAATTVAERVDGGWRFTGHKIFGSLSPVWTYFGLHGMDISDPDNPQVVHAFLPRDASGYRIVETWDALGMRATASHDTVLEGAFVPDHLVASVSPAGNAGAGLFHLNVMAWALLGFGTVYAGIAQRAFDLAVASAKGKTTLALNRTQAHHPEVQRGVAEMRMTLESIDGHLGTVCREWSEGVDHGAEWPIKIVAAKHMTVTSAWSVIDRALELAGGGGLAKRNRLEQIFRDGRLGRVHPTNPADSYEIVAKGSLGIDPDEQPRWG